MNDREAVESQFAAAMSGMIWPFGNGVLMTSRGDTEETKGMVWIVACADGFTKEDGVTADQAWERFRENGAPHAILHFATKKDVRGFIELLEEVEKGLT